MDAAAPKLSTLGKYSLIASLGQGGMAKVYLALMAGPAGFNKLLVIKALREDILGASDEFVQMFLDEARLAARLNHPNIVQTYEVGEAEGRYFIAMEYLEGQSLRTVQRRLAPNGMPLDEEIRVIADTARGLHYAHELKGFNGEALGVVHRDVSPQNVFLTYDGGIKLLDFGIAKTQDAEHMTKVGVIKGKIDYIAPEQVRGDKIDRRADIFALGAMLWEAAAGRRFAGGPKVADVTKIHARVTGAEPKLREVKPDIPSELEAICNRAIALNPNDRYATALDLADDLDSYLERAGLKPSTKTLSELVGPAFEAERAKMRKLVDQQIQIAQRRGGVSLGDSSGGLPRIGASARTASGQRATNSAEVDLTESGFLDLGSDSIPTIETLQSMPTAGSLVGTVVPQRPRSNVSKIAFAFLLAAAVTVGALLAIQEPTTTAVAGTSATPDLPPTALGATQEPALAAPAATPPAEQPSQPPTVPVIKPETVRVSIDVWPKNARVMLDGSILPKIPFSVEVVKDKALHHLEVRAEGYETDKQVLTFEKDHVLNLVLEKEKPRTASRRERPRATRSASPAPRPTPEPAAAPPSSTGPKPGEPVRTRSPIRKNIDHDNPYN